jgi:hypothetical protein
MGARGPKKMTADQLKTRGAGPHIVRARQAEERAAQRPLTAVAPARPMPKVPKGLTGTARELFKRIASPFVLDEQPVALLTDAGLLRQRAEQARQQVVWIGEDHDRP